jgi:hypothetical protein
MVGYGYEAALDSRDLFSTHLRHCALYLIPLFYSSDLLSTSLSTPCHIQRPARPGLVTL